MRVGMPELTDLEIQHIVSLIKEGKPLPARYKILFESKKEYELVYAGKQREQDILADTMAVPLQPVKTLRNGEDGNGWTNMLIFGDNLQVLKTLLQMKQEGKLKNADGTPGVRLVYIDPPFATKQEFRGSQDQKAYQDKIAGARFLEFLRKRLVFLRELLSEDGCIYVHLDWKKGHYVKVLMDEVFGEQNFRNDIIVKRIRKNVREREQVRTINTGHDTILFYAKTEDHLITPPTRINPRAERWHSFEAAGFRRGMDYELFGHKPAPQNHWRWTRERAERAIGEGKLRPNPNTGKPEYLVEATEEELIDTIWSDVSAYSFTTGYPTEKNETLIDRIIRASSNPGDLVLDCFAGSGTTLAVAEKLGRRWIGVDCGKLAIYTMQKRLLNIGESKDLEDPQKKKKYGKSARPFTLYNAGLYDYKMLKELPWEQYREFALKLFQCRDEPHTIAKIELDGYLGDHSVLVFNFQKHREAVLDRAFIDDLHKFLGDKIGRRFFIIAPFASVSFLEDYVERDKTKYFVFRIPYSIIEEIHNGRFTSLKQPASEEDVNDTVDAVGFDFIHVPTVECKYFLDQPKKPDLYSYNKLECVIKVEKFESKTVSRRQPSFSNLETLSMVMIDFDFNGDVFDLDEVFYAENLRKTDYEIRFPAEKVKNRIMIIYIDIFGNEKREVKSREDFEQP
jgi:site-specific DNA-methyltransferase (adenine-specific)/adenine-specific DNA-methyltransferase